MWIYVYTNLFYLFIYLILIMIYFAEFYCWVIQPASISVATCGLHKFINLLKWYYLNKMMKNDNEQSHFAWLFFISPGSLTRRWCIWVFLCLLFLQLPALCKALNMVSQSRPKITEKTIIYSRGHAGQNMQIYHSLRWSM